MHVQLKLVLDCPPDAAWAAIRSPEVFRDVAYPLVEFEPLGVTPFPERWDEAEFEVVAHALYGIFPLGTQRIALNFRTTGAVRIFEDSGGATAGPLAVVTRWRHRMAVAPAAGGGTLLRDRVDFSAGAATPLVWVGVWLFWQWRAARLRRFAPGFARRFSTD
ncbi:hypothetical protein ACFPJ4_10900 [Lysinimonas soli]|uniref:SRPBCC family protein n=1 Tax=Lysinimonas soli TaxID=1074233 RepID=A0ABW0NQL5_9MICO